MGARPAQPVPLALAPPTTDTAATYHISLAVMIEKCMDRLNAELVSVISAAAHNTETVTREKTQNSIDHVSGSNPPVHKRMCE